MRDASWCLPCWGLGSAFQTRLGEGLDEQPLEQHEQQHQGRDDDQGAGADQPPLRTGLGRAGEGLEADRQDPIGIAGRRHQGPEELVPVEDEAHHGEGGEVRPDHRHEDVPQDAHPAGPVQHGSLVVLRRDAAEPLADEEDPVGTRDVRHGQARERVAEAEGAEGQEVREDQDDRRQEQLQEHDVEDALPAREPEAGESVASEGDRDELDGEKAHRVQDRVAVVEDERRRLPGEREVLERRREAPVAPLAELPRRGEGRQEQERDRPEERQGQQDRGPVTPHSVPLARDAA